MSSKIKERGGIIRVYSILRVLDNGEGVVGRLVAGWRVGYTDLLKKVTITSPHAAIGRGARLRAR